MGDIERDLRIAADAGVCGFNCSRVHGAYLFFSDTHEELALARTGDRDSTWSGCCDEAMSEAIEAAEALGL